jgi:hypothetical protein
MLGLLVRCFPRLANMGGGLPSLSQGEKLRIFKALLLGMRNACRAAGAEFAVLYLPHRGQKNHRPFQDQIAATGAEYGFRTLDCTERF